MNGWCSTTAAPRVSMPRRPARPVSCVYSPGVSSSWRSPSHLDRRSIAAVRAGMLMPSDSVSVAKTTLTSPCANSSSTASLNSGSMPAWWLATPRCSDADLDALGYAEVEELGDAVALVAGGEVDVGGAALGQRLVAARPGEDEVDRRQQALLLQQVDDLDPARHPVAPDRLRPGAAVAARVASSHSPNSSALETVADSAATLTSAGRLISTSSQTAPRTRS